ncbi:MAG: helix-turn-helix transcriptional regulator [Oscillospiraceae bacterium]|nr:helix-turn-helix transcriptional regulator [Oscillospiraceae bacterium]
MSEESLTAIVGANIEKCRTKAGLTQSELAEKAGVGVAFISRVERGQKLMKLQTLRRIAEVLNVSCDALLYPESKKTSIANIQKLLEEKSPEFISSVEHVIRACVEHFPDNDNQK